MSDSSIITVAGAKGGVGKTTTSINLSARLAATGGSVALVELDLAMANLVDFLTFEEPTATVHDVLAGSAPASAATSETAHGVDVLPSGTDLAGYADADLDRVPALLEALAERYDRVVVDTGAGLSRATVEPLRHADGVLLVATPRVAAIRDGDKTRQLADRVDTPVLGLVLTMSGTGRSPGADRIADFLTVDLLGHVPEDTAVAHAQDRGEPVVAAAPECPAADAYRDVASAVERRADTAFEWAEGVGGDAGRTEPVSDLRPRRPAADGGDATAAAVAPVEGEHAENTDDGEQTEDPVGQPTPSESEGEDGRASLRGRLAGALGLR